MKDIPLQFFSVISKKAANNEIMEALGADFGQRPRVLGNNYTVTLSLY